MAQGSTKLGKAKHKVGAQKRKSIKSKRIVTKGQKVKKPTIHVPYVQVEKDATKAINRKNEAIVAAKAMTTGTRFFLSDVKENGKKEMKKQHMVRDKKEKKKTSVADKVRGQIDKLEKGLIKKKK
jgi:hypothetical protein